ncbi:MAG TPA: Gfo/Idh/MocA family oxidoreductase [Polyangia bacterium]|nr:Gfo/Idh/MocA family oxidoreductase [Polyangia bacterium]
MVGQGHFAQAAVLPAFASARGCELKAIFSDDRTKLAALKRKYGVAAALAYDQYDDYLAAGEVDAVYITLPNDLHRDYATRAAKAGVHVLCEKPMGRDAADAEAMIAACDERGVKLMVAYRLHFEAATLEAIDRVRRGQLGRPRFFSSTFALQVKKGNIRTKEERAGGPLLDLGIYCVNAARSLFGAEPIEVSAMSATIEGDARFAEVDEQVCAILRFPDERVAQFVCSFGAYDHSHLTVVGDKGRLQLEPAYEYATGLTLEMEAKGKRPRRRAFPKVDQIAAEVEAFAKCIREGAEPEPSGEEGLADMRVLDAIRRSIERGATEPVAAVERRARPSKRQGVKRPPHGMPPLVHTGPSSEG